MLSALILSLALSPVFAFHTPGPSRKSLSFGPVLPHAQFVVNPPSSSSLAASSAESDPRKVAIDFVNELSASFAQEGHSYWIREDSYTDSASGVSHFYFRQLVRDFEVADGNINVNVYNGKVISYGDSVSTAHRPMSAYECGPDSSLSSSSTRETLLSLILMLYHTTIALLRTRIAISWASTTLNCRLFNSTASRLLS
jgi:hypothetical protein